jgi:eukaryotic-like serine/threonine-protein kinase
LKKLGKYELLEEIGRGAMGAVYKAHDPTLGRFVAVKTIMGNLVGNTDLLDRFYQEARSAGTLQHPNIVTVYELGQRDDTPFIAMEFLEGESLDKLVDRGLVLPLSQKVGFIVPVCRALDYAHRRGIVHRDIKPGNVMLTKDGVIKVVDFGIARLVDASKTQTNIMIGTMGYMSPQQFRGERADQRSDIWAVGVMLYELLCLRRPFEGDDPPSLILNIVDENKHPLPVRDFAHDCSPELEALIGKMLRKDANERFQTMEEVLFELEPIWRTLQEKNITGLVVDSEVLIRSQDYSGARELLRKAMQIDSRNDRAKSLLDQVNAELKRIQIRGQVAKSLEKAQALLNLAGYQEAQKELELALKLDPSSDSAHELLAQVQRAANRARQVLESVRLAKLRLAEGALTEADDAIHKALELDAVNPPALTLQKQIQEQLARRAERRRLVSILQRARECWADQRLEESIAILSAAQNEFPGDPEIAKLLETARHDQDEQQQREKLAEARRSLAAQRYDEALAIIAQLQPADSAVQKLRDLVLQEKAELTRQHELQKQIAHLHSLVNAEKFSEARSRGEILLREFPGESEISEIVNFARAELAQVEARQDLEVAMQGIRREIYAGKYREAVAAAEKAIARFPRQSDLAALLEQARTKLKEEENRELLQKRLSEIRRHIAADQHTNAADLARQTLSTVGPDTQVTSLLRVAEMEIAHKQQKKGRQQKQIAVAKKLLAEGELDASAEAIQEGLETKLLSHTDPHVLTLLKEVEGRKRSAKTPDVAPPAPAHRSDVASDYVFLQSAPFPRTLGSPSERDASAVFHLSETVKIAPLRLGIPAAPAPAPAPAAPIDEQIQKVFVKATVTIGEEPGGQSQTHQFVRRAAASVRQRLLLYIAALLAIFAILAIIVDVRFFRPQGTSPDVLALASHAQQMVQQHHWPEALKEYDELAGMSVPIANRAHDQAARLKNLIEEENSLYAKAQGAESGGDVPGAKQFYQEIAELHGDREPDALSAIAQLGIAEIPLAPPARPAPPKPKPAGENCQLLESDYAQNLDRADRSRAQGEYDDAVRQYSAVLACEPSNEHARAGLERTKAALDAPKSR